MHAPLGRSTEPPMEWPVVARKPLLGPRAHVVYAASEKTATSVANRDPRLEAILRSVREGRRKS